MEKIYENCNRPSKEINSNKLPFTETVHRKLLKFDTEHKSITLKHIGEQRI